jgi:hypothetical protein
MNKNKCVFFTYLGKETKFITKFPKNTNVNILYILKFIRKLLAYKEQECIKKYSGNGIYTLNCPHYGK